MPTVEERIGRLRALKEKEAQQDREKEEHRLSCLKELSRRARDLLCLCYECVSNNIGIHQFKYSLREPYSCGFILMGRWKLVITLEEKEPSLLSWYRDKHVAVYTSPESLLDVSVFTKERWKRKDIFIEGFCEEDLRVLDEKLSKFEKDFYTWFDEKFGVKE